MPTSATYCASYADGSGGWTNGSYATSGPDAQYAEQTPAEGTQPYGFFAMQILNSANVPDGSTIISLVADIIWHVSQALQYNSLTIYQMSGGTIGAYINDITSNPLTDITTQVALTTPSLATLRSGGLGVTLGGYNNGATLATFYVESILFTVTYSAGGSIQTVTGLAKASVKTIMGLAIASVKTDMGLT